MMTPIERKRAECLSEVSLTQIILRNGQRTEAGFVVCTEPTNALGRKVGEVILLDTLCNSTGAIAMTPLLFRYVQSGQLCQPNGDRIVGIGFVSGKEEWLGSIVCLEDKAASRESGQVMTVLLYVRMGQRFNNVGTELYRMALRALGSKYSKITMRPYSPGTEEFYNKVTVLMARIVR